MILEYCLASGVDFLITGDKDLLDILDLPFKLKIMTPSEFAKKD
jgi:predicted nucleic acid-binding protein